MKLILIHGSGHKAKSWDKMISYMENKKDILTPDLSIILNVNIDDLIRGPIS